MADKELEIVRTVINAHNSDLARWYAAGDIDAVAAVFARGCLADATERTSAGWS